MSRTARRENSLAKEDVLRYGLPDYRSLRCRKCGNTTDFSEYAFRDTKQPFVMKHGEPDWDLYRDYGSEDAFPNEIVCTKCEAKGIYSIVWRPRQRRQVLEKAVDILKLKSPEWLKAFLAYLEANHASDLLPWLER